MKYLITEYVNIEGKENYKSLGLYCYSLRHNENNWEKIESIENHVLANLYGSIITTEKLKISNTFPNNYIDFIEFEKENEKVKNLEELDEKLQNYGTIDLSNDTNIEDEFYSIFESCENYDKLNEMNPKEKRNFIIEYYEQVNDYQLINKGGNIYDLIYINKDLKRDRGLKVDRTR